MSIIQTRVAKLQGVQSIIGHQFADHDVLWEALQAAGSGVTLIGSRRISDGNKRLATLGDSVLKVALTDEWYASGEPRGRVGQFQNTVITNPNLDRIGRLHGLDSHINRNQSQGPLISPNVMADTVEAIIGAVYLDSDITAVKRVMRILGLVPT